MTREHLQPDSNTVEVGVIGSARLGPEDGAYSDAVQIGGALASEGWTVVTGGYGGLMGAAASGAVQAGGHAVGLPMAEWTHLKPHESHSELRWASDYAERLRYLMATDVVVALPGGIGTLSEASMVWAAAQTEARAAQLVLVGPAWRAIRDAVSANLVADAPDVSLARCVDSVGDVVEAVRDALLNPAPARGGRG